MQKTEEQGAPFVTLQEHPQRKKIAGELRNERTPQAAVLLDVFNCCILAPNAIRHPSLPFRTLSS
ncbi:hypothetical protein [Bacillus sp. FJAT-28004]|uniref:hypothetical protein n=1 Tax=Bacillus sp. FJAT-28004 TaxID=1679165 RepID=UPI0006B53E49|nr:hypothetical protein [Bacillus sp. FJAT-28004]